MGYFSGIKRNELWYHTMNESQIYAEKKEAKEKKYILYDSTYIKFKLIYSDRKQISGCLGIREGESKRDYKGA